MSETTLVHADPSAASGAAHDDAGHGRAGTGVIPVDESLLTGTVLDLFQGAEALYGPDTPMLLHKDGGRWHPQTYPEVKEKVRAAAAALLAAGIKAGDKVAIMSTNRPEWALADLAVLHAGAVSVPVYDTLTPRQAAYVLNDSGARVVFVEDQELLAKVLQAQDECPALERIVVFHLPDGDHRAHVDPFEAFLEQGRGADKKTITALDKRIAAVKPGDLASIVYTSGTTGDPKGVMLTHDNFHSNVKGGLMRIPLEPGIRCLSFLPLSHCFERVAGYYIMVAAGASIHYAESIAKVSDNIAEVKPHVMASVPRLYEKMYSKVKANVVESSFIKRKIFERALKVGEQHARLVSEGHPVPPALQKKYDRANKLVFSKIHAKMGGELKFFVSGGAALSPAVEIFFNSLGVRILQGYGLTETTPVVSVNAPGETRFGSVGRVIPGVQVAVADDGEILVKGRCVMKGYYNKPEATKEVIDDDGWLHTGDIGHVDADGYLFITDRKKEIFVLSNGKNVPPQPIENQLKTQPHIAQAVLIGDGRNYCTALIAPDFEAVQKWADEKRLNVSGSEALVAHPRVQDLVRQEVENVNGDLARYEQVKMFRLLPRELTQEAGELTPSLKTKRRIIDERYADLIEEMYPGKDDDGDRDSA